MYKNLKSYIDLLEKSNELIRIKYPVSQNLEIAEITDRVSSQEDGGKALLFEKTDSGFPVLTNMFGSDKRIALALGVNNVADLTTRIDSLFNSVMSPKRTILEKLQMIPLVKEASNWLPKNKRGKGVCQEVVIKGEDVDLSKLPILTCAPYDAGPFITLPLVHSYDPTTGARNIGMYRMQVFGKNKTGMHWHTHKTGERHYRIYKERGELMPISVVLGGDPSYTYSATAPLPDGIDEYMLSGFIRNRPVELVKCITNNHRVPSDADFIIEGYVDPSEEKVIEGAFADHTGFYSLEDYYPTFHITCITHRKDAIYPATLVGIPPKEDSYIAKATEKIFLSPIKAIMQPEVRDMWLPSCGVAHNLALVDIHKTFIGQGMKVGSALLGAGQMMFTKFIVITESMSNKLHLSSTQKEIIKKVKISRDITITEGVMDVLDHTSSVMGVGGKMSIDATNDDFITTPTLPLCYKLGSVSSVNDSLSSEWSVLFVTLKRTELNFKDGLNLFCRENNINGVKFIIAFDENVNILDYPTMMWLIGGNVDAKRDTYIDNETLLMDARAKFDGLNGFSRRWPNIITMSEDVVKKIDLIWDSLSIGNFIPSPSNKYRPMLFEGKSSVEI